VSSSSGLPGPAQPGVGLHEDAPGTLRVEAVFHDVQAQHADTIAAELISRAHELANLPEYECDVDVNIQRIPPEDPGAGSSRAR
jgi:hypothetical protein